MKKTILAACAALALTVACTPAASAEQVPLWYTAERSIVCNTHGQIRMYAELAADGEYGKATDMLDLERCGVLQNTMMAIDVLDYNRPFARVRVFNPANNQTFHAWIAEWQLTQIQ